jgi:undecaprenyl-diphosphatase
MHDLLIRFFADYFMVIPLLWALWIMLRLHKERGLYIVRTCIGGIVTLALGLIGGKLYYHERPYVAMHTTALALNPHDNSFPSIHGLLLFSAAFAVWLSTKNWRYGLPLTLAAIVVEWARVLAHVHYFVDIVGALGCAIIGIAIGFGIPTLNWMRKLGTLIGGWLDQKMPV